MKRWQGRWWIIVAIGISCSGCAGSSMGTWVVDRVETPDGKPADPPRGFALELQSNGAVKAEDGCNTCSGSWTKSRNESAEGVIDVLCTRMYCEEYDEAMKLVGGISTWSRRGDRIVIPSGPYQIVLRKK